MRDNKKHYKNDIMTTEEKKHTAPVWTELKYPAQCKSPYLVEPIYIPEETEYWLCREDGSRKQAKLVFVVFKHASAPKSAEWEDDPMTGDIYVNVLGDGDETVEPARAVNLGTTPEKFIRKVREDDTTIVFNISWRMGKVKIDKAEKVDDGYAFRKEDFGEEGIECVLTPRNGKPFSVHIQIPYIGFSLFDPEEQKVSGEVEIPHGRVEEYTYSFTGDDNNDRFSISLDEEKLVYLCVLHSDGMLSVRDMRDRLAAVGEIPAEGTVKELLMGAHSAVVKNRNNRWRIQLGGTSLEGADALECDPHALVCFAFRQFTAETEADEEYLARELMPLEQKLGFQWMWLKEEDWSHEQLSEFFDVESLQENPEEMMRQALLFNRFETFMRKLTALSYITRKPIQGDLLQARNNKRKISRCAKSVLAHRAGTLSLWEMEEEERREILRLFSTFHKQFTEEMN